MDVPQDVTVKDYFQNYVPNMFEEQLGGKSIPGMEGTEFTLQFTIDGTVMGVSVKDAKELQVLDGGLDNAMMAVELSEAVWRDAINGKLPGAEMFTDLGQTASRKMYDTVKGVKGTLDLELSDPDVSIKMVFNGGDSPAATLRVSAETWGEMQSGKLPGPMAFMQGKLKMEGDMAFVMSLNALMT